MNTGKTFFKNDFYKGFLRKPLYTIVIVYNDGRSIERNAIDDPWPYMTEVKKDPKVKTAYIKDSF